MSYKVEINGAPIELISLDQMALLHTKLHKPKTWLLDTFFSRRLRFDGKDSIPVGSIETTSPLAPFVAPCVEHQPITGMATGRVDYVKPAYLKPKETITPCEVVDQTVVAMFRQAGIISGSGQLSPADRLLLDQQMKFARLRESIDNRKLLMAVELMTTGKMVIQSDHFPAYEVSYGADAAMSFTPAKPWSDATATPVQDINNMLEILADKNGPASIVITTTKVWNSLLKHQDFNDTFVKPYAGISVPYEPGFTVDPDAPVFRGYLPNTQVQVWTYDAKYKVAGGSLKRFLPEDFFGIVAAGQGAVAQAQIENLGAFGQALDYFDDFEYKKSPSALHMYCESAPLIVPSSANWIIGGTGFVSLI